MEYSFVDHKLGSIFILTEALKEYQIHRAPETGTIHMLWNRGTKDISILLDDLNITLPPNRLMTSTYFQKLKFIGPTEGLAAILFNRAFYCISDHDQEIGCNGILFFGTQEIPIISLDLEHQRKFETVWSVMLDEFSTKDNIQGEMLQMLLKRFIILCTRLAKEQLIVKDLNNGQIDTIRKFNFLVDSHFRTKRKVKDYADMLHKSSKTLANLFSIYNQKSPKDIIQERVVLEAKRMLIYSDKQTKEIAFDLGFDDPAHFSKYFKKIAEVSPSVFRESYQVIL